ncbi:MAG: hypothetical protein HYZ47_05430, partial [Simkania negevensis]|nr:hypothetical protein [Simkania negevensis]
MNRLESLQLYPVQYRKVFYFGAPTVCIFFTLAILISYFKLSFQEAQSYWYIPALIGGAFTWYVYHNVIFTEETQGSVQTKEGMEADTKTLKEELEKSNRSIKHIVKGLMGVFAVTILLRPPFFCEIGQITDLSAMCCLFAVGSYFRQVLHVYSRTPGVSKEEIEERFAERGLFQILAWAS